MIILTIRIKGEDTTFAKKEFLADNFDTSKGNPKMVALVEDVVKESQIESPETVIVISRSEW